MFDLLSTLIADDHNSHRGSEGAAGPDREFGGNPATDGESDHRELNEFDVTVEADALASRVESVPAAVHSEHAEALSTLLSDPTAFDPATSARLGEAYLTHGATTEEFLATGDAALDAVVDAATEAGRSGDVDETGDALKRRLRALLGHLRTGTTAYDGTGDESNHADAILSIESVLEAIPFPVYMLDKDTRVIGWNYGHTAFVGMSREEAIGKTSQESVVKATYSEGARKLTLADKVIECPRTAHREYDVQEYETPYSDEIVFYDTSTATNLDDETIHVEFWAVPIFDENDEFVAVFELIKDRTEEVHTERAMESLVGEVQQTLQALGDGDLGARASFDDEHDAVDDDLLTVVKEVNEVGERLQSLIADVADQTADLRESSGAISENSQAISAQTDDQVEKVESLSAQVSQISASVQEIAATAENISEGADDSRQITEEMRERGEKARETLSDAATAADDVAEDVDSLTERIEQIDEVVDVINDIAEQTNMLALNASIEAARAGEEGDGFAVVADEVKSLAEESQTRAGEIEEMVDQIQHDTEETLTNLEAMNDQVYDGIDQVQSSMGDIHRIVEQIQETAESVEQVSMSTDDQAERTQEVAALADELVDTVEEVAADIDQVAAANTEQTEKIDEIDDLVHALASSETDDPS